MVWNLKRRLDVIDLDAGDMGEFAPHYEGKKAAKRSDPEPPQRGGDVIEKAKLETKPSFTAHSIAHEEKNVSKPSTSRGWQFREKWAPHTGHGLCTGIDGSCVMGNHGGRAANAFRVDAAKLLGDFLL